MARSSSDEPDQQAQPADDHAQTPSPGTASGTAPDNPNQLQSQDQPQPQFPETNPAGPEQTLDKEAPPGALRASPEQEQAAAITRPGNAGRDDYPRMLYHSDGRTHIAESPEEHDKMKGEGWDTIPAEVHRQRPVTASPGLSGGDPMAETVRQAVRDGLREVLGEMLDERGIGVKEHAKHEDKHEHAKHEDKHEHEREERRHHGKR